MPTSLVQLGKPSDKLDKGKHKLPLKPIQPTQYWTFDNVLTLLRDCQDPYLSDALDEFLLLNSKVFLDPSPFTSDLDKETLSDDTKDISLRSVLYTNITPQNIKDAKTISKSLHLELKEVVRVICQTNKKIPTRTTAPELEAIKSKLHDESYYENKRLQLYISKILRERRIVLSVVTELLSNKTNAYASSTIQNLGKEIFLSKEYLIALIASITKTTQELIKKNYVTGLTKDIDNVVLNETILFCIEASKVLIELSVQNINITGKVVHEWFKLMRDTNFALVLGSSIKFHESFSMIQGLFTVLCVQYLDLNNSFDRVNESATDTIMSNVEIFKCINGAVANTSNTNPVVLYSWSIILLRKLYFLQEYPSLPNSKTFLEEFSFDHLENLINIINQKCADLDAFLSLKKLNELLKFDKLFSGILSSLVIASMPLVTLTPDVTEAIVSVIGNAPNHVIEAFFENSATINAIIIARTKFPLILNPYIQLASINGNFALHEFNDLKSYIQVFKKDEFDKMYQIDDQNTELVKTTQFIDVYPPFEANKKLSLVLSAGTKAKLLPSADPNEVLVTFLYNYNGWAFLGRVLQNVSKLFNNSDVVTVELVVNILNLLNKVVLDNSVDDTKLVLEAMSAYTDDSDILEVILRLLEQGLHLRNVKILVSVVTLLTNLMPFLSYRIWPYLSKSALLTNNGKEGLAAVIFGAVEMINGDYSFTISLLKLAEALTQNCLTLDQDYPQKSKSVLMHKFAGHLVGLFETFAYCRYDQPYEKLEIGVLILDVFSTILASVYGVDEGVPAKEKVTKVFADAAQHILEAFLIPDEACSRAGAPIITMIENLSQDLELYELTDVSFFWHDNWIRCAFSFSQLLLTIRSSLHLKPLSFEKKLFTKAPELVTSYSRYESVRKEILDLLTSLTNGNCGEESTPSLLSHLGNFNAQVLLHSLAADLDNSFDDYKMKISLYDFICAVMNGKQEGLAVLFITGRDVFGDFTKKDATNADAKVSLLQILKKNIRDMKYYPNSVSIHLVDAIALACNSWTTVKESEHDEEFIKTLISRVKLQILDPPDSSESYISRCYELKLVSKIAEILSLYLFSTRNETCKKEIINFVNSDEFVDLAKNKFAISNYQPNLDSNLQITFENAFPGFKLGQFTSGLTKRNRFGITSVYNLALMDSLFKNELDWSQIREQVIASSINLQYLNSQLASAKSFGALITSFCRRYDGSLHPRVLDFINYLLKLNINEGIPTAMFKPIYCERIELGFFLIYTYFSKTKPQDAADRKIFEIIKSSSTLLSSSSMNFFTDLAESKGYYKPLLKILYCALNLIKSDSTILAEYLSLFRDLFNNIVTKGTKVLLIEIQNDAYLSRTQKGFKSTKMNERIDDLMIILSTLKVFVKAKAGSMLHEEMAVSIEQHGTIKSLLNLYAFSHSIEVNDEFIFAQLSLMYLLELMSVQVIAEKIVSSGLYVVLLESPISQPIRAGGVSISHGAPYHRLWTNGILPIIITSLFKLGASVVPEVCVALQLFGKQTQFGIDSWAQDASSIKISTGLVAETSEILLIYDLLKTMDVSVYLKSLEGTPTTDDSIDMRVLPGLDSEAKRDDFVVGIENLLKHPKYLSSKISPSSIEEQHIIQQGGESFDKLVQNVVDEIRDFKDYFN
ncbi:hypothetical protein Cantr_09873 [Candida viswanathii]|uniref:Nucleoporin NUP188 n=1 Tax=Candida viswanathii TaxID=5486 RepID=A0A367YBX6_9ASCO|nr:hypothetical protein Cantr_09873 [Candida viswanathii]